MYNPIRSVDGAEVPSPSSYQFILSDVSKADSGRTEDGKMWKEKIGQLVKIELEWSYLTIEQMSEVLTAFDPEYIEVEYLDAKLGVSLRCIVDATRGGTHYFNSAHFYHLKFYSSRYRTRLCSPPY